MRLIGYIRVSTREQAAEGVSLDAQRAAVEAYCTMRGFELIEVVCDEGVSAGKELERREGGAEVLRALRSGNADGVVSYKLDRLFRDAADCLNCTKAWDRLDASLHLIDLGGQSLDTSTAMGRFFLTVMAGAAEMERNLISERTSAAMQFKKSRGEYTGGGVPYGFTLNEGGDLVENPAEKEAIRTARVMKASGSSLRAIAKALAERGHTNRRGTTIHHTQVKRLLAV